MPQPKRSSHRLDRINDLVQQNLAMLLLREVKDPRLHTMTISGVQVSRDLGHAKIFYVTHTKEEQAAVEQSLKRASAFLRSRLAELCGLRIIPELHFHYDPSFDEGDRIGQLLREAQKKNSPSIA
jgi:ribosome-binding factor A